MAIPAHILATEVLDPVLERTTVGVGAVGVGAVCGVGVVVVVVVVVEEVEMWREQVVIVEDVWVVLWLVTGTRHTLVVELTVTVVNATCGTVTV